MAEKCKNSIIELEEYENRGYLLEPMRCFYLSDYNNTDFESHYHEFHKIILCLQGDVEYTVEGKSYLLEPNDIVIVNQNEIHKLKINQKTGYERIVFYISPGYLEQYKDQTYNLLDCMEKAAREHANVIRIKEFKKSRLNQIVTEIKQINFKIQNQETGRDQEPYAQTLYLHLLFLEFMIHLNRAVLHEYTEYVVTDICNQKVIEIISFINQNLQGELCIDVLASQFYMSKYHMMRIFREETGYTIGNYINQKRLFFARNLLLQGISVMEVCYESGFKELTTFSRAYKKLFGISPGKSRKIEKNKEENKEEKH